MPSPARDKGTLPSSIFTTLPDRGEPDAQRHTMGSVFCCWDDSNVVAKANTRKHNGFVVISNATSIDDREQLRS